MIFFFVLNPEAIKSVCLPQKAEKRRTNAKKRVKGAIWRDVVLNSLSLSFSFTAFEIKQRLRILFFSVLVSASFVCNNMTVARGPHYRAMVSVPHSRRIRDGEEAQFSFPRVSLSIQVGQPPGATRSLR